ncbi:polymorphic toxin-type HINT domain-containing protein [Anatilimnocola floriformis]|uniref:polymorphic toxin-type HINT domain-containing protein n=1 Tax=Anatilimnocola floriformis TaxID=2948575 RepID=UPI0020C24815|nr:polymorphic toxin-type HINT domain-containing protein [Anatilimnocola floriformis]
MCTRWRRKGFSLLLIMVGIGGILFLPAYTIQAVERSGSTKESLQKSEKQATEAVREALQREVYGLMEDREKLLSEAALAAPDNRAVRWQLGYVRTAEGEWLNSQDHPSKRREAQLRAYDQRRNKAGENAQGQFELADWCAKQGLRDQERVHLQRVCELEPNHAQAWGRLGFVRVGNRWVSGAEIARQQTAASESQKALAWWTPRLEKIAANLAANDAEQRAAAVAQIREIKTVEALPALQRVIASRGEQAELLVVEVTAAMTDPAAVAALARHAVFSPSLTVRKAAVAKLQTCSREQFVPLLASSMFTPVRSRIEEMSLPNGRMGYRHAFIREGAEAHELMVLDTQYRRIAAPNADPADSYRRMARDAQSTALAMEQAAAAQNAATTALNDRIGWVLNQATAANLPAVPDEWWSWWLKENEVYVATAKSVATIQHSRTVYIVERDPTATGGGGSAPAAPGPRRDGPMFPAHGFDCLVAGTPVWTERGELAIEKIRPGDLVLSRDVDSGELAYKPVLRTTVRPEGLLVKISVGKEVFETSSGHPFWVSGQGWRKARELEAGMVLNGAFGPLSVVEVGQSPAAPTYNLIVADFNTYFVGHQRLLSHDNTMRQPTKAIVPGLLAE